ncbi:CoA-binding protein [Variovorax terrae]|uniref:CoA-binding protein n=1 Tax=Variovorax terrae TaxID=2923278 RepID=A0A9X1VTK9_9BURK|nr:CoA-binding protein [Variovorax terrae]MCJ0761642.1 CoA-binding protein [Variovorax terrae]
MNSTEIPRLLRECRTIAVVGLSPKPHRDSHAVAHYLQAHGYRIIPVNPNAREVLGETAYASLAEAARHATIDLVDVFRHSEEVPPVVDEAIAIGARAVWLQLGIEHEAAAARARAAGLQVVQDRCIKIEHAALAARGLL